MDIFKHENMIFLEFNNTVKWQRQQIQQNEKEKKIKNQRTNDTKIAQYISTEWNR